MTGHVARPFFRSLSGRPVDDRQGAADRATGGLQRTITRGREIRQVHAFRIEDDPAAVHDLEVVMGYRVGSRCTKRVSLSALWG